MPPICPTCGSNLPKEASAGLCPKCVFDDFFKRLQESDLLWGYHLAKASHVFHHYPPGTKFGDYELEMADASTPEAVYELTWALTVLKRALARTEEEYRKLGKENVFEH